MNCISIPILFSFSTIYLFRDKLKKYFLFFKLMSLILITGFGCYLNISLGNSFYDRLYNSINENKCLAIKFSQWIITRLNIIYENEDIKPIWLEKFNNFFENCPSHDFKHTQKIYFNLFQRNILDDYDIDFDVLSSGSIGQVYKAIHKESQEVHAIKVKHPKLEEYMYLPRLLIRIIISSLKVISFQKFFVPLDIEMFFVSLEQQLDFKLESENMKKMFENFKDNYLIVIPKVINYDRDIIIMTFEEGSYFEKCQEISEYHKFKIALTYILFYHQCCYLDNFNHGDLHEGNWKVRLGENGKDYCLVIYDLGLCYTFPNSSNVVRFIESWENYDMNTMAETTYELLKESNDVDKHPDFKSELFGVFKDNQFKPFSLNKVLSLIYNLTRKYTIILDFGYLNILISGGLCEQMLIKYKLMNVDVGDNSIDKENNKDISYKTQTLEYINFCQSKRVFPELEQYYRNLLKDKNVNLNTLFSNLDEKLNSVSKNIKFESSNKQLEI